MTGQADWPDNAQPKIVDQVEHIVKSFGAQDFSRGREAAFYRPSDGIAVGFEPDEHGGIEYMHAEGEILVRDEHVDRVLTILEERQPRPELEQGDQPRLQHVIGNIFQLRLGSARFSRAADALTEIDQRISPGVATPNHVLTVAPAGSPCPATEPEQVYYETEPCPSVCRDGGGAGVKIYMADTGLLEAAMKGKDEPWLKSHPWLRGVTGDLDPGSGENPIPPYAGHGTFAAGVARCMAPGAEIFVDNEFSVAGSTFESDLVRRLVRALRGGVDIFHLGIAAHSRHDLPLIALEEWLRLLRQYEGVVCVAPAGNSGLPRPAWPGVFSDVVCVGALGRDWHGRAMFSNFGGWVDVYAPGRDLVNAYATGTYECHEFPYGGPRVQPPQERNFYGMAKWSGTSFSGPLVAGLIAARMSRTGEHGRQAAASLLGQARAQAVPGVGPVLLPCCSYEHPPARPGECCCRTPHHRPHGC